MTEVTPKAPGFGRDEDMEQSRPSHRPAKADLDGDAAAAADKPITVSPDPDEDERPES
ncbi:hypothetical protein [uncultured Brevundimonas sp.]|uniref:hypothetical protein n=1 Tax=uncultured Brevundimonas sp. TaxID=213418 RepID=UPI0030EDE3F3|tara:strand:- start:48087 stop:48260 length:174 start_codon:yes stop_codon:yes gene_type:complete